MASVQAEPGSTGHDALARSLAQTRARSVALAAPLSDADATVQSMPDASPAKWHLAHTTWFFETFVLRDHLPGYRIFDPQFAYLFNSYYEAEGARHPRAARGLITRPALAQVLEWRAHVDAALADAFPGLDDEATALVTLGIAHEEQHQELMLTDMLHLFAQNPLRPAVWPASPTSPAPAPAPPRWIEGRAGPVEIGHAGDGFAFDCEGPRHMLWLAPHALADRLVTNAEWRAFIADGGYARPELWLSEGWAWARRERIEHPLYWQAGGQGGFTRFGLDGLRPLHDAEPVAHVSFYEADAYARWAGARLPTEAEWEAAAAAYDPRGGNQLDFAGPVRPHVATGAGVRQMFGDLWEWTGSAFLPYPGYRAVEGAVGEYNGKFMSGQCVLRGGSCATPRGHLRASYRNFFPPDKRWQFSGLRLARDV